MKLALLFACSLLTGCGQTGGLYHPDEPAATTTPASTAPATPPAEASEEEARKKK